MNSPALALTFSALTLLLFTFATFTGLSAFWQSQTAAAADAAALAAATSRGVGEDPCLAANEAARINHARLLTCYPLGSDYRVIVTPEPTLFSWIKVPATAGPELNTPVV